MYIVRIIPCILLLIVGFSCRKTSPDSHTVRLALLKGPSAIAFSGLLDSVKTIRDEKFETVLYDDPSKVQALMIQKRVDVAVLPFSSAVNLYNKNSGYSFLASPVWGNLFWVSSVAEKDDKKPFPLFLSGQGTTPDVVVKYLRSISSLPGFPDCYPDYRYSSPQDLYRALLGRQVSDAVLPEPFVSMALQKDSTLFIRYDLAKEFNPEGFPQTAVVVSDKIIQNKVLLNTVDSLLAASVKESSPENPATAERLIRHKILPRKIDLQKVYDRCRITYRSRETVRAAADSLLRVILKYDPRSIGNKIPDDRFFISESSL